MMVRRYIFSIISEPKAECYVNAYISLIISKVEVKEVVFKPKNDSPSAGEKAFQDEAIRILKSMPRWTGGNITVSSYEIPVRDLR